MGGTEGLGTQGVHWRAQDMPHRPPVWPRQRPPPSRQRLRCEGGLAGSRPDPFEHGATRQLAADHPSTDWASLHCIPQRENKGVYSHAIAAFVPVLAKESQCFTGGCLELLPKLLQQLETSTIT